MLAVLPVAVLWVAAGLLSDAEAGTMLHKWINSYAGPWTAYLDRISMCEAQEMARDAYMDVNLRVSHWNPHRPDALQTLTGNVSLVNLTISDDDWVRITLALRSNNEWKRNALVFSPPGGGGCTFVRSNLPGVFQALFSMDPKAPGPCVVSEGTHILQNRSVDWDAPNFPSLPYGHYLFDLQSGSRGVRHVHRGLPGLSGLPSLLGALPSLPHREKRGKPHVCVWAEIHIIPKVSQQEGSTHQ